MGIELFREVTNQNSSKRSHASCCVFDACFVLEPYLFLTSFEFMSSAAEKDKEKYDDEEEEEEVEAIEDVEDVENVDDTNDEKDVDSGHYRHER